jgi:hypothetical protein
MITTTTRKHVVKDTKVFVQLLLSAIRILKVEERMLLLHLVLDFQTRENECFLGTKTPCVSMCRCLYIEVRRPSANVILCMLYILKINRDPILSNTPIIYRYQIHIIYYLYLYLCSSSIYHLFPPTFILICS